MIREYNGQTIKDATQLKLQVAQTTPGTKVPLSLVRDGETKTLDVTVRNQPNDAKLARNRTADKPDGHKEALAGVAVADLDRNLRAQVNVPRAGSGRGDHRGSAELPGRRGGAARRPT